jgi:hypothetical protein
MPFAIMPVWSLAVASGTDLSRLTIGSASTIRSHAALRRLMPLTPLGPGCCFSPGPHVATNNRFAHVSSNRKRGGTRAHVTSEWLREPFLFSTAA